MTLLETYTLVLLRLQIHYHYIIQAADLGTWVDNLSYRCLLLLCYRNGHYVAAVPEEE